MDEVPSLLHTACCTSSAAIHSIFCSRYVTGTCQLNVGGLHACRAAAGRSSDGFWVAEEKEEEKEGEKEGGGRGESCVGMFMQLREGGGALARAVHAQLYEV